ncbi:unnamed protein product, partial [Allacma fusca]
MLRELDNRYQGIEEPLSKFICIIDDFYERINPSIPESTRIEKIIELMHPHYRAKVTSFRRTFTKIRDLMEVAYEAQNSVALDREYRQPNWNAGLEPSLSYKENKGFDSSGHKNIPEIQKGSFDQFASFHSFIHKSNSNGKQNSPDSDSNWRKSSNGSKSSFPRSNSPYPRDRHSSSGKENSHNENNQPQFDSSRQQRTSSGDRENNGEVTGHERGRSSE